MNDTKAFTLIELLVVVLIIGILAAVALPQYNKAVEKSKATQAFALLKTLGETGLVYKMATGDYPLSFEDLDVEIPAWAGNTQVGITIPTEVHSSKDWNIVFFNNEDQNRGVRLERLTGPYRGAAFQWQWRSDSNTEEQVPKNQIICIEETGYFKLAEGDYCTKLFRGTKTPYPGAQEKVFKLP
ncbi:type IV pilin protein [Candidatus Avelusimicrobium luingense]|uniref:type IV pilin protein n=1 Tax=Candidatus Avelusimicrobium luingense TaxID=3416211 RepID=UPI003D09A46F